ncbi:hypothetical protein FDP41_006705 [Naegleria fowleri]|uniref:Uncharacterized protein n=1 Tax=Naegleria fowleri TaxID=5763 RepID=A0A6A5BKD8_NAEFO|nr:uncharacterized protein FDP41_006705 [Naegleria fowleri]KAF0974095.1 hypothetical protein FDP41_006705 [Naegleria fowleri]
MIISSFLNPDHHHQDSNSVFHSLRNASQLFSNFTANTTTFTASLFVAVTAAAASLIWKWTCHISYPTNKKNDFFNNCVEKDDDECMKFGTDEEPLCELNNFHDFFDQNATTTNQFETRKLRKIIIFLIPSLFTDHRIFNHQTKVFGNLIETIDLEKLKEMENSKLTLHSYAQQLARQMNTICSEEIKNNSVFEGFLVGGFCVGGMISILLAQELLKSSTNPKMLKGILLIGSCPSFTHCVDLYYMNLKRMVMNYLPTFIFELIVKIYLWSNSAVSAWMEKSVLRSLWNQDQKVMEEYQSLLKNMMVDKDPEFVIQMLKAEFNFSSEEGQEDHVKWTIFTENQIPIFHIHGDHDYLIQSSLCEKTLSTINT